MTAWVPEETSNHQDHVIAHVLGATLLGYLSMDETAYLLLDIGFVWRIYLDGEMGLLPHPVAVAELEADDQTRTEVSQDIDLLLAHGKDAEPLTHMTAARMECLIQRVDFVRNGNLRRLLLTCEEGSIVIETSLDTREFRIMNADQDSENESLEANDLSAVARAEREFVYQRLKEELKREPTEEEVDEWLREQTEGY